MVTIITVLHVFVCLFLILVVLLQAGKGGGMGIAFGGSTSNTVFGGSGAGNFLTKLTAITAVVFMLTSLLLAYFASARGSKGLQEWDERLKAQASALKEEKEKLAAQAPDAGPAEGVPIEGLIPFEGDMPFVEPGHEGHDHGPGEHDDTGAAPAPGAVPAPDPAPAPAPGTP